MASHPLFLISAENLGPFYADAPIKDLRLFPITVVSGPPGSGKSVLCRTAASLWDDLADSKGFDPSMSMGETSAGYATQTAGDRLVKVSAETEGFALRMHFSPTGNFPVKIYAGTPNWRADLPASQNEGEGVGRISWSLKDEKGFADVVSEGYYARWDNFRHAIPTLVRSFFYKHGRQMPDSVRLELERTLDNLPIFPSSNVSSVSSAYPSSIAKTPAKDAKTWGAAMPQLLREQQTENTERFAVWVAQLRKLGEAAGMFDGFRLISENEDSLSAFDLQTRTAENGSAPAWRSVSDQSPSVSSLLAFGGGLIFNSADLLHVEHPDSAVPSSGFGVFAEMVAAASAEGRIIMVETSDDALAGEIADAAEEAGVPAGRVDL